VSDTNTKVAFWVVGAAAAAAIIGTLTVGARAKAAVAPPMAEMSATASQGASAASSVAELPSGLSLLPLVQGAAAGANASAATAMLPASGPEVAGVVESAGESGAPLAQVAFESGQTALSPKAKALLLDIAAGVKKMDGATLVLSGFHDTSGSPEVNARVAKERAQAVRDELVAKGMPAERIKLQKPQIMVGGNDPALARRVDIGLLR
jgi:outer membrane protein OmpA-like peptidoglycan-associated protein